jgi:hypothetical protein
MHQVLFKKCFFFGGGEGIKVFIIFDMMDLKC